MGLQIWKAAIGVAATKDRYVRLADQGLIAVKVWSGSELRDASH